MGSLQLDRFNRLPLFATCSTLVALAATTGSATAQVPQANYPMTTDLVDTTGNFSTVSLAGTATGPTAMGACTDGIYLFSGGSDVRTPNIGTLDTNDFEIEVEFSVAALGTFNQPILIGGNGWRWIGFQVQNDGTMGILHNNAMSVWSTTMVTLGAYHTGIIKYEAGDVELQLDGSLILSDTIGVLDTGSNLNFTSNNFSNGTNHNGCLRNLTISNDTTLGGGGGPGPIGTLDPGCTSIPNSTGMAGSMSGLGQLDVLQNDCMVTASNLPPNQFCLLVASQTAAFVPGSTINSNGNLCLGGNVARYNGQLMSSGPGGSATFQVNLDAIPLGSGSVGVNAGETWYFQTWHRDQSGLGSNFTDSLCIAFE